MMQSSVPCIGFIIVEHFVADDRTVRAGYERIDVGEPFFVQFLKF